MRSGKKPRASSGRRDTTRCPAPEGVRGKPAKHEAGVAEEERLAGRRPSARTVGQCTVEIVESKQASRNWGRVRQAGGERSWTSACDAMRTGDESGRSSQGERVRSRLRSGGGECVRTER
ncbi:hypothetical protein ERJ75_000452200 [Trypanosoma vivax]|nr:hypothetical protein ERJ75_000452200 [Trypanosoma vivax]